MFHAAGSYLLGEYTYYLRKNTPKFFFHTDVSYLLGEYTYYLIINLAFENLT